MSNVLNTFLDENLLALQAQGLYNEIDPVEGANGPIIKVGGKQLVNLSSNNYLGLATNDELKKSLKTRSLHTVSVLVLFVQLTAHLIYM